MDSSIDSKRLIDFVVRSTEAKWIGVSGSAKIGGDAFTKNSDIDVIVEHEKKSRFIIGNFNGREIEIHQYSTSKIHDIKTKPQWFGGDWVWQIGKIHGAETLYGSQPQVKPDNKERLIGIIAAIGLSEITLKKIQQGRLKQIDISREIAAIKYLVDGEYPNRYSIFSELNGVDSGYANNLGDEFRDLLKQEYNSMLFYPEHFEGVRYLNDLWNLGISLPNKGTAF